MRVKFGVVVDGIQPPIAYAIGIAGRIYNENGQGLVVTSIIEGDHMSNSKHPKGFAADLRTDGIPFLVVESIYDKLVSILNPLGYDLVPEYKTNTAKTHGHHIHIEYDPKQGERWYTEVA